jgi:hypothetical protein
MHRFSSHEVGQVLYPWGEVTEVAERAFDRAACLDSYVAAMPRRASKQWGWRESKFADDFVGVRGLLSRAEAEFWFAVGTHPHRLDDTSADHMSDQASFAFPDDDAIVAAFAAWIERFVERCGDLKVLTQAWLARVLCDLLPPGGALRAVVQWVPERAVPAFLEHLLPPTPTELAAYRSAGSAYLAALDYTGYQARQILKERRKSIAARLAPMLRDAEATDQLLDLYEREPPASRSNAVMHLINAVEDDQEFLERFRKRVKEWGRREVVLLLGRMGESGLDVVRDAVVRRGRDTSEGLATALELVDHPTAGELLVYLAQNPTSGVVARDILMAGNPAHVAGLLHVAAGRSSRAEFAESLLQELRRRNPVALDDAARERADVDADLLESAAPEPVALDLPELGEGAWPRWLQEAALNTKPRGLPRFMTRAFTPVFMVADGEHVLPKSPTYALLAAARDLDLEPDPETGDARDGRPLLERFAEFLDSESAAHGFKVIFERWNQDGCLAQHDWCLRVLGVFGDDAMALDLARWVDEWPKHDLTETAETAVDVLAEMNSDTALMALNGIAQRGTFAGIRRWARNRLDKVAVSRGLGGEELRDMVVDHCGLDADGTMVFDYGARQFSLVFDDELKPRFRDDEGKTHRSLPRARKSDDASRVQAAKARYKLVKKRLAEVIKTQRRRLEDAMIDGRRVPFGHWRNTQIEHPLLTHLVQRFVWGAWLDGELTHTFRVDESRELVDVEDEPIDLSEVASTRVGLLHPLELSDVERREWASIFGDYEIVPPFAQLDRPTFARKDTQKMIEALRVPEVPPGALRGQLKRMGWNMGYPSEDGLNHFFSRRIGRGNMWAWLILVPGLNGADWRQDQPQHLANVGFTDSRRAPAGGASPFLPPTKVDRVAWSELMRMMHHVFRDDSPDA